MKKVRFAIAIAAVATLAALSPASAKARYVAKAPICAVIDVPLFLGVGY